VKDEKFYFTIYVKTRPAININGVGTEGCHRVYFKATSDNLNFGQLASLTTLKPTNGCGVKIGKSYEHRINSGVNDNPFILDNHYLVPVYSHDFVNSGIEPAMSPYHPPPKSHRPMGIVAT
jgi:hypothetical protein